MFKLSIRRAIVGAFFLMIIVILSLTSVIWNNDYDWLVHQQGQRNIEAMVESTVDRVGYFLDGPRTVTELYGQGLLNRELYNQKDLSALESFSLDLYKEFADNYPQISTIGYGDEKGRYIGIRYDSDLKTFNLMLKDERTKGLLNIYEGETIDSKVIASYEGYDPRVRPWYAPAAKDQKRQWSDFYINFDEKKEATISILYPNINKKGQFLGVTVVDVKLNGINDFLKAAYKRTGGYTYIMDSQGRMIGQSDDSSVVVRGETEDTGRLMLASESENPWIKTSANALLTGKQKMGIYDIQVNRDTGLTQFMSYKDDYGLNWTIGVALPIDVLVGTLLSHQFLSYMIIILVMSVGLLLGLYALNRLMRPIAATADAIESLSEGQWGKMLEADDKGLAEVSRLVTGFNKMSDALKHSFDHVQASEEKYRLLVENAEDLIYSIDMKGNLVAVNGAFEKVIGLDRNQIIGKPLDQFFKRSDQIKLTVDPSNGNETESITISKSLVHLINNSGKHMTFNMTLIPIIDANHTVMGYTGTNHDLTGLMDAENEKIASLSYLVSGIAHGINTPIGNCVTMATFLASELEALEVKTLENQLKKSDLSKFIGSGRETCDHIVKNLEHGSELVEAFKTLAVNKTAIEPVEIHLKQFIEIIYESVSRNFENVSCTFDLECDDQLLILSEQIKLSQMITELFENAFYHGFEGRKHGHIRIVVDPPDDNGKLIIHYKDNGQGIAKGNIKDVLTPFYSTKFGTDHSGLGLNMIYNTVKSLFNGEVIITEQQQNGFEIKLVLKVNQI